MTKRIIDIVISIIALIFFLPFGILISLWIVIDNGFPVFFTQTRIGKNLKPFKLIKFRSMKTSNSGSLVTASGDARITASGRTLRKLKLDEFPQLINVLKGEMSLVGPRPEVKKYVDLYSDKQKKVLSVKPGITGLDSLNFSNEEELMVEAKNPEEYYIQEIMPKKIALNLEYIKEQNILKDFRILKDTLIKIWS